MDVKNTQGQSQRENIPFSISPTWQRLAYQTSPVSVRAPEVATMPKNTHTKKKQAVCYGCRSHGNRSAEGVPVPALIYTNSNVKKCSRPPPTVQTPPPSARLILQKKQKGPHTELCVNDLLAALVKSATRGKRIRIPETRGLQCSFAHFPSLIKTTHSQGPKHRWASRELRF